MSASVRVASIVPPPRHHEPSYSTTACPGETALMGSSSCTDSEESGLGFTRLRERLNGSKDALELTVDVQCRERVPQLSTSESARCSASLLE